jgi:hypothetical protein
MATSNVSATSTRSPITIAAGFIGAFIVASLAVQMVRSQIAIHPVHAEASKAATAEPVIPAQASLWSVLGER